MRYQPVPATRQGRVCFLPGVALLFAAVLLCWCPPLAAGNLLGNGGFESGFAAPWGVGQYGIAGQPWLASGGCRATASRDDKVSHTGRAALCIANPTSRAPNVFASTVQRVRIVPNQRYRISLWARGRDLASRGAVNVIVDPAWAVRPIALPAGSFAWTRFTGTFQLNAEFAEFRILSEDRGSVWLDDILLEPDTAPPVAGVATASATFADTPPPFHPGLRWLGNFWDGWDFHARVTGLHSDGTLVYALTRWRQDGSARETGTLEVQLFGARLTAIRRDARGRARQYADGMFGPGGRYLSGLAWNADTTVTGPRVAWWATVETDTATVAPARVNLNLASVAVLEAFGLSPRAARALVEGRLVWGKYNTIDEALAAPGLTTRERARLRERADAR